MELSGIAHKVTVALIFITYMLEFKFLVQNFPNHFSIIIFDFSLSDIHYLKQRKNQN